MKKIILPALFGVMLLASCKKDYTCECTTVDTQSSASGSESDSETSKTVFKDVSKKFMKNSSGCYSTEEKYSYQNLTGINQITLQPIYETVNVTSVRTCEIKK